MNSEAESSQEDEQNLEFRIITEDPNTLRTYGVVFLKTENRLLSINGKRKQQFEVDTKKQKFKFVPDTIEENLVSQNEILIDCENEDVSLEDPLSNTSCSFVLSDHDYSKIDMSESNRSTASSLNSPTSTATTRGEDEDIFLQKENCIDTADYLPQCRECNKKKKTSKYCCRFYEFRKLKNINGKLTIYGFLDPHLDPNEYDIKLWESTNPDSTNPRLDTDSIKYLLSYVASEFCELIEEEKEAHSLHLNEDQVVAWKRSVQGVRELCDVCETSLFNYHWTCVCCGFSVCLDCYKDRKDVNIRIWPVDKQDYEERDAYFWYKCTNKEQHDIRELMLTQIIAGDALEILNKRLHEVCQQWGITQNCGCSLNNSNCIKKESETLVNEYSGQLNADSLYREIYKKKKHRKRSNSPGKGLDPKETHLKYPNVKHEWLCENKLLRFFDPLNSDEAYQLFQDQWDMGQPVVVSNCTENMNMNIWNPKYFLSKFGSRKNLLVDCTTQSTCIQSMGKFWEGFFGIQYRLRNKVTNKPIVLKLKDWPPSDDFAEIIPEHFNDLMNSLPLPNYTARNGKFNLASHLPKHFVKPDLGPKMYSAYGHADHIKGGSTNLHLDISDAVNVMVYVSTPGDLQFNKNPDDKEMVKSYDLSTVVTALNDAGCDTKNRGRFNTERYHIDDKKKKKLPGAFWHIYDAKDADKIRDLLTAVSEEQGKPIETNSDPIHDQSFFLDKRLRDRLTKDYSVQGYSFIQFVGDAVFIPAGAPHQVRNINDCIKVAEDFVSPENINQCFNLTAEFRELSETHLNHEDKLQIKNILYHTVKNIISHFDIPRTGE